MLTSSELDLASRWTAFHALAGLPRVRSPFQPPRRRPLTLPARGRLDTAVATLFSLDPSVISWQEWVSPDCRGVPHVVEGVVGARYAGHRIHIAKAAENIDASDLLASLSDCDARELKRIA